MEKQNSLNGVSKYTAEDFSLVDKEKKWKNYELKKECYILGKEFGKYFLKLELFHKIKLSVNMEKINEYIDWLASDCKTQIYFVLMKLAKTMVKEPIICILQQKEKNYTLWNIIAVILQQWMKYTNEAKCTAHNRIVCAWLLLAQQL